MKKGVFLATTLLLLMLLCIQTEATTQKEIRMNPEEKTKTIYDADGNYVIIKVLPDMEVVVKSNETEKKYRLPELEKVKEYSFLDIQDHWARDEIQAMVELGLLKGYPDGTFRPNNSISRSEFGAVLARVLELEKGQTLAGGTNFFADIDKEAWYYTDICKLQQNGNLQAPIYQNILNASAPITREEMALWLAKEIQKSSDIPIFTDSSKINYKKEVDYVASQGLLKGYPDGSFQPSGHTTRAEAAAIFVRYMQHKNLIQ